MALLEWRAGRRPRRWLREWMAVFPERFYLESAAHQPGPNDEEHLHARVALADKLGAPVVATNDVRFIKQETFAAHETRVCIGEGRSLDDPRRAQIFRSAIPEDARGNGRAVQRYSRGAGKYRGNRQALQR